MAPADMEMSEMSF